MNLFEEAQAFMSAKEAHPQTNIASIDTVDVSTPEKRYYLIKTLKKKYETASDREIEKAIDDILNTTDEPITSDAFLKKIRLKLEE